MQVLCETTGSRQVEQRTAAGVDRAPVQWWGLQSTRTSLRIGGGAFPRVGVLEPGAEGGGAVCSAAIRSIWRMDVDTLLVGVRNAFTAAGGDDLGWPDPHLDRDVEDEEHSRVSDPNRDQVVGMRTAAWVTALTRAGLATVVPVEDTRALWRTPPVHLGDPVVALWVHPVLDGAVPLLLLLHRVGSAEHEFLVVGAGDPAVEVDLVPDCGCDACDSGSADLLEVIDRRVLDVVTGDLVHVAVPGGVICGRGDGWSASWTEGAGRSSEAVEALLTQARAGRSPHPVVLGRAWW